MIEIGARVRVKDPDNYVSPWKARFSEGRLGTVNKHLPDGRVKVRWDTKRMPRYTSDWELNHWPRDLEIAE